MPRRTYEEEMGDLLAGGPSTGGADPYQGLTGGIKPAPNTPLTPMPVLPTPVSPTSPQHSVGFMNPGQPGLPVLPSLGGPHQSINPGVIPFPFPRPGEHLNALAQKAINPEGAAVPVTGTLPSQLESAPMAAGAQPEAPTMAAEKWKAQPSDIHSLFQKYLGRQATAEELSRYSNVDSTYYKKIQAMLAEQGAAQQATPAATPPATETPAGPQNWASMDYRDTNNIRSYFQSRGLSGDVLERVVGTWAQYRSQPWANDTDYFFRRMAAEEELGGGGTGPGGGSEFVDHWGSMLESQVGSYSAAAKERAAALAKLYRERAASLNGPAYNSGDEANMRAQAFDQLERRRQETLKNDRENVYARGFAPTSGLVRDATNQTNQSFEGIRTGIESNMLQAKFDETNRRKDQAMQLEALATEALNGGDLSAIQQLGLPLSLMNTRQQNATQLYGMSNAGNSSSIGHMLQLLQMGQNNQNQNNANGANNANGIGQLIATLIGALGGK